MSYVGPERRIHKIYVTRNTEYHLRRNVCVRVQDRESGHWVADHAAIGMHLAGAVRTNGEGPVVEARMPGIGDRLCFGDILLVTSELVAIKRPPREIVRTYPVDRTA